MCTMYNNTVVINTTWPHRFCKPSFKQLLYILSVLLAELHSYAYTGHYQYCLCMCIQVNTSIEEILELSVL